MYVQEIILEGFKTYMNRTVITGFDPQFNAITGLNGSGKSNVLDGIQFLLGSTSKDMLRLKTGLTELIYKEGFAGIEKASVTIKFRCADKSLRPTGFQNCEELSVTRQITKDKISKFFVNGQNSNLSKVRNLFRSVQLNIENPHFLVKQGQITKIINLKPLELLAMIQETAGTAYYNKTRFQSERIIQRKEQKLTSINQILDSTIKPQMEKLQTDRKKYAAFKQKQTMAERLNSKLKKHQYTLCLLQAQDKELKIHSLKDELAKMTEQSRLMYERLIEIDSQIRIYRTKGNPQFLKDYNQMKNLINEKENQRKTIKNRLTVIQSESLNLKEETIKNQRQHDRLKTQMQWHQKQIIQYERQIDQFKDLITELNKSKNAQEASKLIQKQKMQEEHQISDIKQEIKLMEGKKDTIKKDSDNQKKVVDEAKHGMQELLKTLKAIQTEIQNFKNLRKPHAIQDPQIGAEQLRKLQAEKKRFIQENYRLSFNWTEPSPSFNRSLVKGKLFMIFQAKQSIHEKALQIGAGAKLFNVVVENQMASQALLKGQSFGSNVTIIPNNKIRPFILRPQIINNAKTVASQSGGLAKPAYELIDFPKQLQNSIMFAFGGFIICSSPQIAKKIAYNQNRSLSCKCVTYEGDVYEPGTLTGGSDQNIGFVLSKYNILRKLNEQIAVQKTKFDSKNQQFQQYLRASNDYKLKEKEIEATVMRRDKIKQKLSTFELNSKPKDYTEEINAINKRITSLTKELNQHQAKVKQLSSKGKGSMKSVEQQKQNLTNDLKKSEKRLAQSKKQIYLNQAELNRLMSSLKMTDNTQMEFSREILQLETKESDLINQIKERRIIFEDLQEKKLKYQKQLAMNQSNLQMLEAQENRIKRKQQDQQQIHRHTKSDIQQFEKEVCQQQKKSQTILRENPWLDNENTDELDPDFRYEHQLQQFNKILIQVDKMRKTVKVNVDDHSYQKLIEQYKNLLEKKAILENDKITLLTNMHDLDDKRTKTLQKCFQCVKDNLGSIFNDLLPGATAHLSLIDQADVTKGAQLRVHFNQIKKELSQLSGGQRSLLALSFILALLLYKPSPFYILDEIDSALDLSHTENIGYMISKRFPQSQFILISLKQGMFQNANVLYRVHFSEGQSKVDRQVLKKKIM